MEDLAVMAASMATLGFSLMMLIRVRWVWEMVVDETKFGHADVHDVNLAFEQVLREGSSL